MQRVYLRTVITLSLPAPLRCNGAAPVCRQNVYVAQAVRQMARRRRSEVMVYRAPHGMGRFLL